MRQLKLFKIKTFIIKKDKDLKKITNLINHAKKYKVPVACLIEPKTFSKVEPSKKLINKNLISRQRLLNNFR